MNFTMKYAFGSNRYSWRALLTLCRGINISLSCLKIKCLSSPLFFVTILEMSPLAALNTCLRMCFGVTSI